MNRSIDLCECGRTKRRWNKYCWRCEKRRKKKMKKFELSKSEIDLIISTFELFIFDDEQSDRNVLKLATNIVNKLRRIKNE